MNLNRFKRILVIQYMFSDCSGIKSEMNSSEKISKYLETEKHATLRVKEEIKREIRTCFENTDMNMCDVTNAVLSFQRLPSGTRKIRAN